MTVTVTACMAACDQTGPVLTAPSADPRSTAGTIQTETGKPVVIDGDTIDLNGLRFRLEGIDTPETRQQCRTGKDTWDCGQRATAALKEKIRNKTVSCSWEHKDRYQRRIGTCYIGTENLNGWLVSQGWALAYRRYSTAYVSQEKKAAATRHGIWSGDFVPPWDWRRGKRLPKPSS